MKYLSKDEKETHNLGKKIAKSLSGGEVIALIGELGAGKTVLTKGLASGLGIKQTVNSPTFVVIKIYHALKAKSSKLKALTLVHIDAYRLKSGEELLAIGALDYFGQPNTVTVIEWADRVKNILPKNTKFIYLKNLANGQREIKHSFDL